MAIDLPPPKLWIPEKPAIIRQAKQIIKPVKSNFMPGYEPHGVFATVTAVTPIDLTFIGSNLDETSSSFMTLDTYNVSNFAIGDFVVIAFDGQDSSAPSISSIFMDWLNGSFSTVGSLSPSIVVQRTAGTSRLGIASASVGSIPGNAVFLGLGVEFNTEIDRMSGGVWRLRGANSSVVDTESQSSFTTNRTGSIDIPSGGVMIAIGHGEGTTVDDQNQTWSNATEQFDFDMTNGRGTGAHFINTGGAISGHTFGFSSAANTTRGIIAASWGPAS